MIIKKQQKKSEKPGFPTCLPTACYDFYMACVKVGIEFILFVGHKVLFTRAGKCKQCGKCCRHVYLRDGGKIINSFDECLSIVSIKSDLSAFRVKGRNTEGDLFFGCEYVGRNNCCSNYAKRPVLCRAYPNISMLRYGAVPKEDCGYIFVNRFTRRKIR